MNSAKFYNGLNLIKNKAKYATNKTIFLDFYIHDFLSIFPEVISFCR